MNGSEGLRRIAAVVRWIGMGLAVLFFGGFAWFAVGELYAHFTCGPTPDRYGVIPDCEGRIKNVAVALGGGMAFAAFFYLGARATAWIIEGFAAPK